MRWYCGVWTCLFACGAWAQVNVERYRGSSNASLAIAFDFKETATSKSESWSLDGLINTTLGKQQWLLLTGLHFGEKDNAAYRDNSFVHGRFYYRLHTNERQHGTWEWGPESFAQSQADEFSNQRHRDLLGVGGRVIFDRHAKSFRGGLSLMRERLEVEESGPQWFTRGNLYGNFTGKIFSCTLYYQPDVAGWDDYNLAADGSLAFTINEKLVFETRFAVNRNRVLNIDDRSVKQAIRYVF